MLRKFLVIGMGGAGRRAVSFIRELVPECEIAVWNTGRKKTFLEEGVLWVNNFEESYAFAPECVFIATPTSTHLEYATAFLNRTKCILIDKPMDSELNRCEVFARNARTSYTKVFLNYQRRFMSCWQSLYQLIRTEETGEFLYGTINIASFYPDWRPEKDATELYASRRDLGGGVLLTECHEIDLVGWLLSPIVSVSAKLIQKEEENSVENQALLFLELDFPYGRKMVNVVLDDYNKNLNRSMEMHFEKVSFSIDELEGRITVYKTDKKIISIKEEVSPHKKLLSTMIRNMDLEEEDMALPGVEEGLAVNAVIHAARKSMETSTSCPVMASICPAEGTPYLEKAIVKLQDYFGDSLKAIYGLGSLGYGGYVEGWSDFDIDVLVDTDYEHAREVYQKGKEIEKEIQNEGFERIDIRVYNYEHLNVRNTILTYGQCSRATMLCDSAILLAGEDIRRKILRPTLKEQNEETIRLLKHMLANGDNWWSALPWDDIAAHFALIARFLYTNDTGKVVGKRKALEYIIKRKAELFDDKELQWILWALACRQKYHPALFQSRLHKEAVNVLKNMFYRTLTIITEKNDD